MGLDMYLYRRRYVQNWDHYPADERTEITAIRGGQKLDLVNPTYIIEQVGYWRKANHIHKWFVDNVQGGVDQCQQADVDVDDLQTLLDLVKQVLADHSRAEELLPTQSGFFFGGTGYDEYYFEDLEETKKILEPIIERESQPHSWRDSGEYYYQSSW